MSDRGASVRLGHRPALDGLRGIAVLAVLAFHCWPAAIPGGWVGVDVFFVLSGFLITTLLLEEYRRRRSVDLARFYARRALRLLPALACTIVLSVVACAVFAPYALGLTVREAVSAGFYVSNWVIGSDFDQGRRGMLDHTWSLAIEEQFYLVWPLLLVALLRLRGERTALFVALAGAVAVGIHRAIVSWQPDMYFRTDTHSDGLLIGAALALALGCGWRPSGRSVRLAAIPAVAVLGPILAMTSPTQAGVDDLYTVVALASAALVLAAVVSPWPALHWRPLLAVGRISYGVYLYHSPIHDLVELRTGPGVLELGLVVPLSLAAAALSFRVVEQPCLRLKRRLGAPAPLQPVDEVVATLPVAV